MIEFIEIKLGNVGKLRGTSVLVDKEDAGRLRGYRWLARKSGKRIYVQHIVSWNPFKVIHMHRFILNAPDGMVVDHINNNGLDNRKSNLRICTKQENNRNSGKKRNNGTKYKGLSWCKKLKKWETFIVVGEKKKIFLGYFADDKDAARAYNRAALKYFKEYARLNILE